MDVTATEGTDYNDGDDDDDHTITLTFDPNDNMKTHQITVSSDSFVEGPEFIIATLDNPTGTGHVVGVPRKALVIIHDTSEAGRPKANAHSLSFLISIKAEGCAAVHM